MGVNKWVLSRGKPLGNHTTEAQSEALRKADLKQHFAQLFEEASDSDISGISIYIHDIWS